MMPWFDRLPPEQWAQAGWTALGAYALGCFATGYYLVRSRTGQDLRDLGTGTLGARNAGRVLGWRGFLVTLLGDFLKGAFAVWATMKFAPGVGLEGVAVVSVIAGHIWPIQLRFHGGKGVATCLGALLLYDYHLVLVFACLFAGPFLLLRRTTSPGLFAFSLLPFATGWLALRSGATPAVVAFASLSVSLACLMVLVAHRKNIADEISQIMERRRVHTRH